MSSDHVPLLCWFNGKLIIDRDNISSYVTGIVKFMIVRKSFIRCEMIEKIHQITKINSSEHQLHLTCKWPVSHGNYQAVGISDDDDCHAMLELCSSEHSIELSVKKDIVIHRAPKDHGQFTCILDLDNESTGFMSPVYNS